MKSTVGRLGSYIQLKIEVEDIESHENLNFIADEYLAFSYAIDDNMIKYEDAFAYDALEYSVVIETSSGPIEEADVFSKFSEKKDLSSKTVNFIENIIRWSKNNQATIWRNDENHLAQDGAFALSMSDPKYIPLYADLLLLSDMDHEVYQYDHIESIVKLHGFTPSTIRLLAYRISSAKGQQGWEQLEAHKEKLFVLFKEHPSYQRLFLKVALLAEYRSCTEPDDNLWFESIRFISGFIAEETARKEWLSATEKEALSIFNNVDLTKY